MENPNFLAGTRSSESLAVLPCGRKGEGMGLRLAAEDRQAAPPPLCRAPSLAEAEFSFSYGGRVVLLVNSKADSDLSVFTSHLHQLLCDLR